MIEKKKNRAMMYVPRNAKIDLHDPRTSRVHVPKTTRKENALPRWIRKNENVCHVAQIAMKANSFNFWYLDSGCSRHMMGNKSFVEILVMEEEGFVTFGDGSKKKSCRERKYFHSRFTLLVQCFTCRWLESQSNKHFSS